MNMRTNVQKYIKRALTSDYNIDTVISKKYIISNISFPIVLKINLFVLRDN